MPHQSREEFSPAAANHLRASNGWRKLDPDCALIPPLRSNTLGDSADERMPAKTVLHDGRF
jgi:hypothetical protein